MGAYEGGINTPKTVVYLFQCEKGVFEYVRGAVEYRSRLDYMFV